MTLFADAEARAHINEAVDTNMFVEAGAGTGKTTAMVSRIVGLLASGATTVESIVAITFTEASAGELKERLRFALEKKRAKGRKAERENCQLALEGLEAAAIQTIHGFAHRIVSKFAVDAAIPPSFELQDRISAKLRSDESWNQFLRRVLLSMDGLTENEKDVIRVGTALGLNQGHLKVLASIIGRSWYRAVPLAQAEDTRCAGDRYGSIDGGARCG